VDSNGHRQHTPPMAQPPPEDASGAQPGCLRDSPSLSPTPKTAKSNAFSRRTDPRLDILCTPQGPPSHPGVSDRQASAGRCPSRASLHPGQLPVCCRTGQQGKHRARVLILLASHFPIVHRICDSISSLMGVVKFGLVVAVRPGEIPTLRARTRRALQRRESPCLPAVGQIRRTPGAKDGLKGGQDSATHPAAGGWILLCVIALFCSAIAQAGFSVVGPW